MQVLMLHSRSIGQPPQFGLHTQAQALASAWYVAPQFKAAVLQKHPHCAPLLMKV